jgi:hypothetical protein
VLGCDLWLDRLDTVRMRLDGGFGVDGFGVDSEMIEAGGGRR